ncbi:MAG TPA: Arm DNA-binding domain-containing protein [Chitinophagaceae bacterium]|nr:Arm DNA-binding domain-containing protein [Chitinophagaceae bacterium]
MLALLDIRLSFLCRTSYKNEDGSHLIVLRISFRNSRRDVFTGLFCSKESWNNKKGKMYDLGKGAISINNNLELIIRKANNAFDALRFSGEEFTIDELVSKLKGQEE